METDADAAYDDEFEAASVSTTRRDSPLESSVSLVPDIALSMPSAPQPSTLSSAYASPILRQATRTKPPPATKKPMRSALDQALWTFCVRATRVRGLRVPKATDRSVSGFPSIRDLRVFGVVDKQPMQSRGSRWKQEARVAEGARPFSGTRRTVSPTSTASSPGRRSSGVLQEASWRHEDGELAWIFTMDRFRRLKAYSPRIKLFVFGIGANARAENVRTLSEDSPKNHRGSIVSLGWFFLDLRTPDLPARWFKLQNSPFGGEILVSTTFMQTEMDRNQPTNTSTRAVTRRQGSPTVAAKTRRREHSLSTDSSFLRLGEGHGSEVYVFTVFIQGASQLHRVLRASVTTTDEERRAMQSGVWLSYSLFDVVVQTDVFYNFQRAEFAPIRDSFRVMAKRQDVLDFIKKQNILSFYLCTHDRVLANADLGFNELIQQDFFVSETSDVDIATISGTLDFGSTTEGGVSVTFSIERSNEKLDQDEKQDPRDEIEFEPVDKRELKHQERSLPTLFTVSHVQIRADALKMYAEKEAIELELLSGEQAVRCPIRFNAFTADYAIGDCPDLQLELDLENASETTPHISATCFSSATDHAIATSSGGSQSSTHYGSETSLMLYHSGREVGKCVLAYGSTSMEDAARPQSSESRTVPGVSHTYRVCIQLNALRDFETSRPVVISYTNPFTNHERIESPLISVLKKAETEIPEAYCLFEVHRDEASMKEAMESPVVIDVAVTFPDGSRRTIGNVIFSLNFLYFSEEVFCCANIACEASFDTYNEATKHWVDAHHESEQIQNETGPRVHSLKRCSIYLPVMSVESGERGNQPPRRVGAVQVEGYFEDMGPMSDNQVRLAEEMRISRLVQSHRRDIQFPRATRETMPIVGGGAGEKAERPREQDSQLKSSPPIGGEKEPYEDTAPALIERSAWMQEQKAQQTQWKKRINDIERARMDELEEEWARREEERSAVLRTAQAEYQKLEQKLRVTLAEVETRERKLALAESALERDQRMLREDTDLLRKRLQTEQSHSLSLAQKQIESLEKKVSDLQANLRAAEQRALQVEEDFAEYRKQQRKVPESKLREEIASLKGQVAELEKARHSEMSAREHSEANVDKMKVQLEKMAKLVQAEKKKNESRVMDDLERLRLKYIAREERYVLDGDREELRAIKKQLDDLRRLHVGSYPFKSDESARVKSHMPFQDLRIVTQAPPQKSPYSHSPALLSSPSRRHSWSSNEASPSIDNKLKEKRQDKNKHVNRMFKDRELQRLEQERDELLASGVYDSDSYLVRELERRIVLRQDTLAQQKNVT